MPPPTLAGLNNETMAIAKQALGEGRRLVDGSRYIKKAGISTALSLVGYELERPAKFLVPVLSPMRNRIPRVQASEGSQAANWRAITGINTAKLKAAVAEGARNSAISYTTVNRSATFKTIGLDDTVTLQSVWHSRGFDDVRARSALSLLQALMMEEEKELMYGVSATNALGTSPTPTVTRTVTDGGLWGGGATDFVGVYCVALTGYGWFNSTRTDLTQPLGNGTDYAAVSAKGSIQLVATTDSVTAAVTPVNGAFAYAWFVSMNAVTGSNTTATAKLAAITTVPVAKFTAPPSAGNTAAVTYALDTSGDANAFDGIYTQIINPLVTSMSVLDSTLTSGTLYKADGGTTNATNSLIFDMLANAANPLSTRLTSDGVGGVKEVDLVLEYLYDQAKIGPTLMIMNHKQALDMTKLIGGSSSGLQYRVNVDGGDKGLVGGIYVGGYTNKFTSAQTPGSPDIVPFMVHPFWPDGTIMIISEQLPYPNAEVANVFEIETQQEYIDIEFAMTDLRYQHGIYADEVLKNYFPPGCALIRGIRPQA